MDQATRLSDQQTKNLMLRLESIYNNAYEKAIEDNKQLLKKYANAKTPEQKKQYKLRLQRSNELINNIAGEIANAGDTAAKLIQAELTGLYRLNYEYTTWEIQREVGYEFSFAIYDRNQIAVILTKEQKPFTKLAFKRLGENKVIVERLQNELLEAVSLGESQQKIIRRVRNVTGQSTRQAKRVVQTERNRVASQGRQMGFTEAMSIGIEMDKQWIARMSNTRDSHKHLNMQIVPADQKFKSLLGEIEFPGDPNAIAANTVNCFCLVKPVVHTQSKALLEHRKKFNKSWEEYSRSRQ